LCIASSEHTSTPEITTLKLRSARAGISKTSPVDADRISAEYGRLQHRLDVRHEVIADHDAEELENILDTQRVIERMREAGTESVVVSTDGGTDRACSGRHRSEA
jgi:hypothetical protein